MPKIKQMFFTSVLLGLLLLLGLPSTYSVLAAGEGEVALEAPKTDEAIKAEAENKGDVAEPPSGPNVNIDTVTEEVDIDTPASVTGQKVDGTGTVTDFSTSGSKAFYTIKDAEQNVFYLIIDLDKTDNNVYFLSDIKKSDLSGQAKNVSDVKPPTEQVESVQAENPKEEGGNNGFLIAVLLLAVVGVAAYYFLVMKKRQGQNNEEDEEDEEMSEDYEDDFYDDEQVNKENQK